MASKQKKHKEQLRSPRPNIFDKTLDPPFEEYWAREDIQKGLKRKQLIQGPLRISQKNFENAFVDDPDGGPDYALIGILARNRALQDDVVVLDVLPKEKWLHNEKTLVSGVAECSSKITSDSVQEVSTLGDVEEQSSCKTLVDILYTKPQLDTRKPKKSCLLGYQKTAKVVYIVEKQHSRVCAGFLKAFDRAKQLALLSPKDTRLPRVVVPLSDCPSDYCKAPKQYDTALFICRINEWKPNLPFPVGSLFRSMGEAGDIRGETDAILMENGIDSTDFSPEALKCLPDLPWVIPMDEILERRDFRKECVFTIDPDDAKDLDDALHIKKIDADTFEIGVHIADVSYFVKPDTALDQTAANRGTSVYLVQKVIPMLPQLLCEELCSLNPNEDRLVFSVVWHLTSQGELVSQWIGKSIIRSCSKLSYAHAQAIIDGSWTEEFLPEITGGFATAMVVTAVENLNKLAKQLRTQRTMKGTLQLNQSKIRFVIDAITGLPKACEEYQIHESNRLIEEFMLLANMTVAHEIFSKLPDHALLRRHPPPKENAAQLLASNCVNLGIPLDVTSASSLQTSLDCLCSKDEESVMKKMVLVSMCSKIMNLALYFCAGSINEGVESGHYALNVPLYTHFTSPIRRYSDVMVHRQLACALGDVPKYQDEHTIHAIQTQADHCNKKKKAAKMANDLSLELFFFLFLKECGPYHVKGIIMQLLDKSFDVFIKFGLIKRVYCEKLPLSRYSYDADLPCLNLVWHHNEFTQVRHLM